MEKYKYEINGLEFEMSRPLTDTEMRFLLNNPGTTYYDLEIVKKTDGVIPGSVWLKSEPGVDPTKWKWYKRNPDNTAWKEIPNMDKLTA
jgi:hypothetical protein